MVNQRNKRFSEQIGIWLPLLLAIVLVGGMLIGMRLQPATPTIVASDVHEIRSMIGGQGRVEELIRYIEAKYVDDVDREELIRQAITEVLGELDPHSNYIPAEDLAAINEQLEGNFDGIGVEFMFLDDTIVIVAPLAGGPSEAVGIQAGDKIVMIEDSLVAGQGLSSDDIVGMLRGEKGSQVKVGIHRNQTDELLQFTITRDEIPMHSIDVATMLDEKTGYIKINRFSASTYEEFVQALQTLYEERGAEDLVIDLRHNPGGYLQQATRMLSQLFRDKGKLLVYTEGRTVQRTEYTSNGRPFFPVDDIVVLIDAGSASASEIVAGALQDHDRGIIIGRRSFGKGLVQEQYPLRDGSALRLTVSRYYTPSGRSIQKPYDDPEAYNHDVEDRYENGELSNGDITLTDSTRFYTASGHVVYGGGGIVPDLFVPLDTALLREDYLVWRQHIPAYIFRYSEQHPEGYAGELDRFLSTFQVSDELFDSFIDYARSEGVKAPTPSDRRLRHELKRFIKARIARVYFGDEGFFAVWNQEDDMLDKALEVLRQPNPFAAARQ
jgi:carboxyl-terminal processing protease